MFPPPLQKNSETNDTLLERPNMYIPFRIKKKIWIWHHPEGSHTPQTEKELLLL